MRSAAIAVPLERSLLRRVIEWAAPWYDPEADDARSAAIETALSDAKAAVTAADAAIARRHQDEVRASFRRANERLGGR